MRTLFIFLALAGFPLVAAAQSASGVVQGTVVAEGTLQPLNSASVVLRDAADETLVAGDLTNASGSFRFTNLAEGEYQLQVTLLGYSSYSTEIEITSEEPTAELGTIRLASQAIALEGVEVTGERSQVIIAPDRTVYSTRDMPVASGGMATDVLRSVPELEVDIEGSVSLRGDVAQIYLNGRPAPMEGESLDVFLQQFPADRIERVEVIANPSARFDAEGSGGIINIVLKENVDLGLSGSLFTNAGTRGDIGAGGRLAYQRGRWTLFGGGFARLSSRDNTSYDLRTNLLTDPITRLEQDASSQRDGISGNVDLTAEYEISSKSRIWAEGRLFRNANDSDGLIAYLATDTMGTFLERYTRTTTDESTRLSADLNLGFRHTFEPRTHEVSVEFEIEGDKDDDWERAVRELLDPAGDPLDLPAEYIIDDETEDESEMQLEVDYFRPWGETGQIELGYRGSRERTDNLQVREAISDRVPGGITRTGFDYRENFNSVYVTVARGFGDLRAQLGLRAEHASTTLEINEFDEPFDKTYTSLFPSGNIAYDLGDGKQVRLSYSRRIRRPSPWVLNPINRSTDPLNRRVGNPDIDPQYTHSVSLESSWTAGFGTLRFSPYYRRTEGDWTEIKTVDDQGVSTVTWENLASVERYGASITASLLPINRIGGNVSLSGFHEQRDASNLARDYSGDALRWTARASLQAELAPSLHLQTMAFYRPARDVAQGRIGSMFMTHLGLRHRFLDNRASINFTVTDPLDMLDTSFETRDASHIQIGRSSWSARRATLSFSYSFGRPPRDARRSADQMAEDDAPEPEIR